MESYEENRVKWLIDKPGGLFLRRVLFLLLQVKFFIING